LSTEKKATRAAAVASCRKLQMETYTSPEPSGNRRRLPNRREAENFDVEVGGLRYTCTGGRFPDGTLAELFISSGKAGSDADTAARDSAVVASIALQFGVPVDTLRSALMRNRDGSACGPLGAALDFLAKEVGQ
jgi:ribonucleoside-diphosphate reductase alpha chain